MERKLATIQVINSIEPIPGADFIVVASVLGWKTVVRKDEFQEGQKIIFCEIDSILPEKPEFEFLRPDKFRVRTKKLKGQISQGLCLPLNLLPPSNYEVGDDVTSLLGITKYEPELDVSVAGIAKGSFPWFISKTDEVRVQNLQAELQKFKGELFYISEKLDGASVTFYWNDGYFGVCSRKLELKESAENTLWSLAKKYEMPQKLQQLNLNIALQGEIIGPKIQGNRYKLSYPIIKFFKIWDINNQKYLSFDQFKSIIDTLSLSTVPYNGSIVLDHSIDDLVKLSFGQSRLNSQIQREGIVLFSRDPIDNGRIFSFKVINPNYLLKYE